MKTKDSRLRDIFYRDIGRDVKLRRESCNLTREELADMIDQSPDYVEMLEDGSLCISLWSFHKVMSSLEKMEGR